VNYETLILLATEIENKGPRVPFGKNHFKSATMQGRALIAAHCSEKMCSFE
jgi:hypothetical protein